MNTSAYSAVANPPAGLLARSSDLILALGVVAIIALMVLPLPLLMLDALVAISIVFGLVLVLMSVYVSTPLQFSVFPSVLLLSTLYRLALSVATTRMILLHGDAGNIIDTFGNMVAGGNLVVGLVVFLIITLVQFIVIAKGAERVAEVAARFSLDAMPGKQLSIDSDLRSGLIDKNEAKRKRREIELESKFNGSMDGAMKFVKGDAIAGIVIILINLLGGLAIGVMQLDMDMSDAMAKYSILTVGDGMVAQIPALLAAMSAGLIVTRATDEQSDRHLGDSIHKQLTSIPRVILITGGISLLLALVPGFPSDVFVVLGILFLISGALLIPAWKNRVQRVSQPAFEVVMRKKELGQPRLQASQVPEVSPAAPLQLELPRNWAGGGREEELARELEDVLRDFKVDLGVQLPRIDIRWYRGSRDGWQLLAYEVPIVKGPPVQAEIAELAAQIHIALQRHINLFMGLQEASFLLSQASTDNPDVVKEVLRVVPMQHIAAILRNLVEEQVPIRNLRLILEALIEAGQQEKDVHNLTEYARIALRRQISYRVAPDGLLRAVILVPELEDKLLQAIRVGGGMAQLSLDPQDAEKVMEMLVNAVREHQPQAVVVSVQLRRHIRRLIERDCFSTPVLSHNELTPETKLEVVSRVGLPGTYQLTAAG
ncbi:FHIPEP family type III secretion protein [Thiolapillus sp.]